MSQAHLRIELQMAAARELRWLPDSITVEPEAVCVQGWAVSPWMPIEALRVMHAGRDVDVLEWAPASDALVATFPDLPRECAGHFVARVHTGPARPAFPGGFARVNVTSPSGEHALSYRTAWYFPDPARERPMPTPTQIERVIGVRDVNSFQHGGATLACRFEALLAQRLGRTFGEYRAALDWGCGAGRLSRYLCDAVPSWTGVDVDPDNIAACTAQMPSARFLTIDARPPLRFADASFDLVFGISVLTHLGREDQRAWLAELRRVTRPGGVALLSVQGAALSCLYREDISLVRATRREGHLVVGRNPQLDDAVASAAHYLDVRHSPEAAIALAGECFEVLDYLPAMAALQDLLVLRRPPEAP